MINELYLNNFKCFEKIKLDFSMVNILTGLNGMGKSTVIQSILLLAQSQKWIMSEQVLALHGKYVNLGVGQDVLYEKAEKDEIGIGVKIDDQENRFLFDYEADTDLLPVKKVEMDKTVENWMGKLFYLSAWLNAENGLSLLIKNPPEDIYYLVLGINDYWNLGEKYLASINDIGNFKTKDDYQDSFYGNYGRIIEEIQEHAPNAKLVMFTCADTSELAEKFNKAIIEIANYYKIPYIVQSENTFFQSEIYQNMSGGHPTALAYSGMANAFEELLNACLIEHQDYFFDSYMYD